MKFAGIVLLLAGWGIVLTAVILLAQGAARGTFVVAGLGVELMGLTLLMRSYATLRGYER